MRLWVAVVVASVLAVVPACSRPAADESHPAAARRPTDEEMGWLVPGLSSAGNSFILAWNRHDAAALAALWHEGGDFVDPNGRAARGRAQIEALFRDELGESRLDFLSGATESSIGKDVRLEDWDVEVAKAPQKLSFGPKLRLHLFLVYSRRPPADRARAEPAAERDRVRETEGTALEPPYRADDHWLLASARAYAFRESLIFDDMTEHEEPLRVGGDVTRPEPISTPPPAYTEMAKRAGIEGVVILDTVVDRDGLVTVGRVVKPLPFGLDAKAREAVELWRFRPAMRHGKPVEVYWTVTVPFSLPHRPRAERGGAR